MIVIGTLSTFVVSEHLLRLSSCVPVTLGTPSPSVITGLPAASPFCHLRRRRLQCVQDQVLANSSRFLSFCRSCRRSFAPHDVFTRGERRSTLPVTSSLSTIAMVKAKWKCGKKENGKAVVVLGANRRTRIPGGCEVTFYVEKSKCKQYYESFWRQALGTSRGHLLHIVQYTCAFPEKRAQKLRHYLNHKSAVTSLL